jgi:hypothetical protein
MKSNKIKSTNKTKEQEHKKALPAPLNIWIRFSLHSALQPGPPSSLSHDLACDHAGYRGRD